MFQGNYKEEWVQTGQGQWFTERNKLWFCITLMDRWYIVAVIPANNPNDYVSRQGDHEAKRTLTEAKRLAESYTTFQ